MRIITDNGTVHAHTLTEEQVTAIQRLYNEERDWYSLTFDMPRINGADAYVYGTSDFEDERYWTITAQGAIR